MRENVSDRRLGPFRSKDSLDLKEKKEKWCEVGERGKKRPGAQGKSQVSVGSESMAFLL